MEWQPIETAPKRRTFILACDTDSEWPDDTEESMWIVCWDGDRWRISLDGQTATPTHWMPLPSPPKR